MIPQKLFNFVFLLALAFSFVCAGCVSTTTETGETAAEPPAEYQPEQPAGICEEADELYPDGYYIHEVTLPDESISIIAKWFTGDLKNWELLAKSNPNINPNRIFLGNTIKIPCSLMTRQDPMTAEFVKESQPRQKSKSKLKTKSGAKEETPPATTQPENPPVEEEPLLFGPKGYN